MKELKAKLHQYCLDRINQQIANAQHAMEEAQKAANDETKSSAGDKFETGRAMMQRERDKNARQLSQSKALALELQQIQMDKNYTTIQQGSIIKTDKGIFYFAIGFGKVSLDDTSYFIISLKSPLGKLFHHKKVGDTVMFNKLSYYIETIE